MLFKALTAVSGSQGVGGAGGLGPGVVGAVVVPLGVVEGAVEAAVDPPGVVGAVVVSLGVVGPAVLSGAAVLPPPPPQPCNTIVMGAAKAKHKKFFDSILNDTACSK